MWHNHRQSVWGGPWKDLELLNWQKLIGIKKSKRWWWVKHFGAWGVSGREEDPAAGGRFDTLADVSPRGCSCSCWLPLHPTPTIWVSPFFFSFCKLRSTANHHLLRWIRPVFRSRYRHTHTRTRLSFFCFSRAFVMLLARRLTSAQTWQRLLSTDNEAFVERRQHLTPGRLLFLYIYLRTLSLNPFSFSSYTHTHTRWVVFCDCIDPDVNPTLWILFTFYVVKKRRRRVLTIDTHTHSFEGERDSYFNDGDKDEICK